mgnify:CR=1 FL=1
MENQNDFEPQKENSSSAENQPNTFDDYQRNYAQEAVNIQNLVKSGILNEQQGQYCMSQLAIKTLNGLTQGLNNLQPTPEQINPFEEFDKEKPNFFNHDGRADVLNYLKNSNVEVDKDEIDAISQMVEKIEQCAIEKYIKQQAHEKELNDENEIAKKKLTANAQNATSFAKNTTAFTREQIGKMSGAEFAKYEPLIMEQLRKGQIR